MVEVVSTVTFDRWLRKPKDRHARLRILERLDRLAHGNPGDVRPAARQKDITQAHQLADEWQSEEDDDGTQA